MNLDEEFVIVLQKERERIIRAFKEKFQVDTQQVQSIQSHQLMTPPFATKKKVTFSPNLEKKSRYNPSSKTSSSFMNKPSSIVINLMIDTPLSSPSIIEQETNLTNTPPNNLLTPAHN